MGNNITDKRSGTVFLDIDGTLVKHNYDPEQVPDVFVPGMLEWVKDKVDRNYEIILTTSRIPEHALLVIEMLRKEKIKAMAVCNLGTGPRILVNDSKGEYPEMAKAIELIRDEGFNESET